MGQAIFCGSSDRLACAGRLTGLLCPETRQWIPYAVQPDRVVRVQVWLMAAVRRRHICTPITHDLPGGCRRDVPLQISARHSDPATVPQCRTLPAACRGVVRRLPMKRGSIWGARPEPTLVPVARSHMHSIQASKPASQRKKVWPLECQRHHRTNCFHRTRSRPLQRPASLNEAC